MLYLDWFQGYLIGNPATGELVDLNSRVPYAHGIGIISDELYEVIKVDCILLSYISFGKVKSI